MRILVANRIRTPDGTILVSRHRHDYVCHIDANGKKYCIDGGNNYVRIVGDYQDVESLSVYSDDPHEKIREAFEWGTYGVNGDQPRKYLFLKDMKEDHIKAVLKTQNLSKELVKIFEDELTFRLTLK